MARACIALGSNLGNRDAALRAAIARLEALPQGRLIAVSTFIETPPVDAPSGSGFFLNAAAVMETKLSAPELLRLLLDIERDLGRLSRIGQPRNAPRVIDLDLLLYDELILDAPRLRVPHPRMHERAFVLRPLAEIAPDALHPVLNKSVRELLSMVEPGSHERGAA